jgi:hypothetical protein
MPHGDLATITAAGDHGRSARPAGARPPSDVPTPAASRSNSLIPCSNSAHSLIFANYLPVPANSLPCSAAQGISPQAIEAARPPSRHRPAICENSLLISLFSK